MTNQEAKNIFINIVLSQEGLSRDGNYEESIRTLINKGQFFAEGNGSILRVFITWHEDIINGQLHIFANNLFIHPSVRRKDSLIMLRDLFRKLYPNAQAYWFNKRRDSMKYRR